MLRKKRVGGNWTDCSRVMALDRGRRVDQKSWNEQMEDEGVEYRQMSGIGETEHTAG